MKINIWNNKDFWAGLHYIAVGALAMWIARDYPFGSALRMGPGYFPTVLGGIMVLFGLYVAAMGLRKPEQIDTNWSLRALIILPIAMVLFGILMEHVGFVPALIVLVLVSSAAGREFKMIEALLLAAGLTVLSVLMFIYGLGLPYPLIKGLWGY
ncbi:MAG TPA: tripartite tricarboxylate transporter TctB family protein [Burkholderiales bacterium]|nr:tripartite tricarboxylate transporter TctB family protein [Burkholderiales bacterium]